MLLLDQHFGLTTQFEQTSISVSTLETTIDANFESTNLKKKIHTFPINLRTSQSETVIQHKRNLTQPKTNPTFQTILSQFLI